MELKILPQLRQVSGLRPSRAQPYKANAFCVLIFTFLIYLVFIQVAIPAFLLVDKDWFAEYDAEWYSL